MHRQCNSLREMGRRLLFLVYAVCAMASVILLVAAVAGPGPERLIPAAAVFGVAAALRLAGLRRLDFERLFDSFPAGCARDAVPEPVRMEVESLLSEFRAPGTGWVRRSEIRHRLKELETRTPEIIEAYAEELHDVLAA